MTVVGDIHGQLQDLFSIFTINGIPCPQNHYIFNGDFVDRGPCGAEVLFTLCAFKVRVRSMPLPPPFRLFETFFVVFTHRAGFRNRPASRLRSRL